MSFVLEREVLPLRQIESYLKEREELAESVRQRFSDNQPDLSWIRARILTQQKTDS